MKTTQNLKTFLLGILMLIILVNYNYAQSDTTIIGNQIWMTKNLEVSTFRNGAVIPEAKNAKEWKSYCDAKKPCWSSYNWNDKTRQSYGKFYNWYAISDPRKLAPKGWTIPSSSQWEELINIAGGNKAAAYLKSTTGWESDKNGNDELNFNAKPGGFCNETDAYQNGTAGYWWTKSSNPLNANQHYVYSMWNPMQVYKNEKGNSDGFNVRCIRSDEDALVATIGNQTWLDKNLSVTKFQNGDTIFRAMNNTDWTYAMKNKIPAYCYYNFDTTNAKQYGFMYNLYAINDSRGLAPKGYRIPTVDDFKQLGKNIGSPFQGGRCNGFYGMQPKLGSMYNWYRNNGQDTYGFTSLPGGVCVLNYDPNSQTYSAQFSNINRYAYFYSSSYMSSFGTYYLFMSFYSSGTCNPDSGFSNDQSSGNLAMYVRCIKSN